MTVVRILGTEADRAVIDAVSARLSGYGVATAINGGEASGAPTLLLWSAALAASPEGRAAQASAISAWAEERLVLLALDDTPLPPGLADLSAERVRTPDDAALDAAAERLERMAGCEPADPASGLSAPAQAVAVPPAPGLVRRLLLFIPVLLIAALAGGLLGNLLVSEMPAGDCAAGEDCRALDLGGGDTGWLAIVMPLGGAVLTMSLIAAGGAWVFGRGGAHQPLSSPALASLVATPPPDAAATDIFVTYSAADAKAVERLVGQIQEAGYSVWIDRPMRADRPYRYAAPVVKAIKASRIVAVMSSPSSFRSDRVLREVYVAGDQGKPFLVFELEKADLPDEFRYFLSGFPRIPARTAKPSVLKSHIDRFLA